MKSATKNKITIPKTIWTLGFISLFMDLSSELIHSILPIFLVTSFGASALTIGVLEGVAEATALIVKIFSGAISDFFQRRKFLLIIGYGLGAITKPFFPMAQSIETIFTARILDRIGKGIRGAPRDALIADVSPPEIRGACFGLRQSMDTIGSFLGPIAAIFLLYLFNDDMTAIMWFAVIPAVISVTLIVTKLSEPKVKKAPTKKFDFKKIFQRQILKKFSASYWWVIVIGGVFTLSRFSEAFLLLRTQEFGLSIKFLPLTLMVMSLFYMLSAYPVGKLSDRINRQYVLIMGIVFLIVADIIIAQASSYLAFLIGVSFWGLHMGFSQGVLASMIADTAPDELKATGFGIFNFVSGILMLFASIIAGGIWDIYGASATFYMGGVFAVVTLFMLIIKMLFSCKNNSQNLT